MLALERLNATRIAATTAALDAARWPDAAIVLRTAPDEIIVVGDATVVSTVSVNDPHAIIEPETGLVGVWRSRRDSDRDLDRHCAWDWRRHEGRLAQGAVAGLPLTIWLGAERVLWIVPEAFAPDLEARLS